MRPLDTCGSQEFQLHRAILEAETNANLWADHFDGSLEEVFDLQDNVAASVAEVIEPTLQIAEVQRTSRRPTTDLAAYDLYLRALAMMLSPARLIAEIENIFDKALERDTDFAPALALAAAFHMNCDGARIRKPTVVRV